MPAEQVTRFIGDDLSERRNHRTTLNEGLEHTAPPVSPPGDLGLEPNFCHDGKWKDPSCRFQDRSPSGLTLGLPGSELSARDHGVNHDDRGQVLCLFEDLVWVVCRPRL